MISKKSTHRKREREKETHIYDTQRRTDTYRIHTFKAPTFFALLCVHMSKQSQPTPSTQCSRQQPTSSSSALLPLVCLCVVYTSCTAVELHWSTTIFGSHSLLLSILMPMLLYAIIIILLARSLTLRPLSLSRSLALPLTHTYMSACACVWLCVCTEKLFRGLFHILLLCILSAVTFIH